MSLLNQLDAIIADITTPQQTTIIEAYGKQFVFNVPLGDHISHLDDEAQACVLQVGEDIYSPETERTF